MKKISKDLIDSITPYKLMEYLKNNGWFINTTIDKANFFAHENYQYEITVPIDKNVGDCSLRISEAISTLSDFENRYEIDIIRSINTENIMVNLLEDLSDGNYVLPKVTRCDVIINGERVRHRDIELTLSIQDDGRTLKVFIDTPLPDEAFDHVIQKDNIIREILDITKDYRK